MFDVSEIRVIVSKYDLSTEDKKRVYYKEIELFTVICEKPTSLGVGWIA